MNKKRWRLYRNLAKMGAWGAVAFLAPPKITLHLKTLYENRTTGPTINR